MTGRGRTKQVDRSAAEQYRSVGTALLSSAVALRDLADDETRYGNAIAVLAVHAAIAWADALCIAYGARKSTDAHDRAPELLRDVLGAKAEPSQIKTLRAVISAKDRVSYTGDLYTVSEGAKLLKKVELFSEWARQLYQLRPPAR